MNLTCLLCGPACTDFEPFLIGFRAVGKPGGWITCTFGPFTIVRFLGQTRRIRN